MGRVAKEQTAYRMQKAVTDWVVIVASAIIAVLLKVYWTPLVRDVDLTDSTYQKPLLPDIVPEGELVMLGLICSAAIFAAYESVVWTRDRSAFWRVLLELLRCLVGCVSVTIMITEFFKNVAGRPRPFFATVCGSYVEGSTNLCTGAARAVKEARKSFPSGHSSTAFAFAVFVSLYVTERTTNGRLGPNAPLTKALAVLAPSCLAFYVAVTRTIDFHHFWSDIIAGTALGGFIGAICYRTCQDAVAAERTKAPAESVLPSAV